MSESVIVTTEQNTVISQVSEVSVLVSESQGPPGPKGDVGQLEELDSVILISDPLAYYILSKN